MHVGRVPHPWAEAVFHVLAHVDVGPRAASCHAPAYVAAARALLGPASERELGADARALASLLGAHDHLASVQALAWLWRDAHEVEAAVGRDLAELAPESVRSERALAIACAAGPGAELLRAAAELELPRLGALPAVHRESLGALERELARVSAACPTLDQNAIDVVRALPRRGRVLDGRIFVGVPGFAGADAEHLAWQAAHEATVGEIVRESAPLPFTELERAALLRLASRARSAGLGASHRLWLSTLDLRGFGAVGDEADRTEDAPLDGAGGRLPDDDELA